MTVTYKATCKLAKSKKAIACTVASSSKSTKFTAKVRLQSKGTASTSKASKSGKLKLTLKSRKALKKGQKVVLSVKSGKSDHGVHRQGVVTAFPGPAVRGGAWCHPPDV